ncbi:hypothetical protein MTO98_21335 [Mucilaginibacter sp. SMC90]|uniref:hypothetical protein n=1 Tax=Mucilaginibacter sp. SMC90 TaxID=2929803 RepID=UPI001FB1C0F6|nr:hypothetical protein [Mucilaginibacter sp. SMC90]UOE46951.1 hypothetical protein MTO98_21335 [Mucilaginibacter sp. SMC90]
MNHLLTGYKTFQKLILPALLFSATLSKAQVFGGNPPSIKWKQVNTSSARVIFPAGLDSAGLRVANIVQQMNGFVRPTIGFKQKQISIVLQNQTTVANGYVGLAPFRSEFYLTPDQNSFEIGSLPWPQQLAIHEFRHVQQYNNFNVGLSRLLRIIFGEGGQALGNDLAVPNWFFEGDAVFNETLVSEQGRGRLPYFFMGYRALWASDKNYSYMKLRNGSYRDYVPDHYPLGYMMVAYGREKYGSELWKNVTHDAAAYRGGFYPFQGAVKKYTGESFKSFSNNGFSYFKQQFAEDDDQPLAERKRHFDANRQYPAFVNDSTLIYAENTYDHLPAFIVKTGSRETKLSTRSYSLDSYFDYNNGKIVYAAYRPDLRWGYRNYSELMMLDTKTGQEHRITSTTKYFSPAFSTDGKRIVAVQVGPSGTSQLHILDTAGKVQREIPNPQGLFYTYPKFYGEDKLISATRDKEGKMGIGLTEIATGKTAYLTPPSFRPIGFIALKKDTLYFTQTDGKNDRLFVMMPGNKSVFEMLPTGNYTGLGYYQPAVNDNKLAWVGFTADGYQINQANKKDLKWIAAGDGYARYLPDFGITALKNDSASNLVAGIANKPLPVTNYSKTHGLFNFHSIIPNISDPNYSFAITGENVLNTFQSEVSFDYNTNEGYKQFGFDAIYGALFPYISAGADYTLDRRSFYKGQYVYWNETAVHGGLRVPLNFSEGKRLTSLTFGSDLYFNSINFQQAYKSSFADRSYSYLNNYISFSNQTQQAQKNIYPRFAQSVGLNYKSAVSGSGATQFLATGSFYFPGLFVNHNFVISLAHQQKGKDNVISFSNDFPFSKGYTAENLDNMNKVGLTYHLPIAYPDAGFGNLFYLLRLRGALFFDYTHANASNFFTDGSSFKQNFRSAGGTLYFDTKFFNQNSITFGIRYGRLLDEDFFGGTGRNRIELVLPVTFF